MKKQLHFATVCFIIPTVAFRNCLILVFQAGLQNGTQPGGKEREMNSKSLGYILYISRSYATYQRSFTGMTELQPSQITLINYVFRHPGSRQDSLTDALGIDKTRLTHRLNDLEKKGYISREISPEDARVRLIYPTKKALEVYPEIHAHFESFVNEIFQGLDENELETIEALLSRVRANAKETVKRLK